MLSTMRGRGRLPAARKPYTLTPKPQTVAGMTLKIERDARTLRAGTRSCRALTPAARWSFKTDTVIPKVK